MQTAAGVFPAGAGEYPPIEHHGVIGDLHTVALVGLNGTIDFMCAPHFDSPTVFASLLDRERGGSFAITPQLPEARTRQLYLPETNVLLTRFLAPGAVAEISDFMPVGAARELHCVVRRVKAVHGRIPVRVRCAPRFDYARAPHRAEAEDEHTLRFVPEGGAPLSLRLHASVPLGAEEGDGVAEFTLEEGESATFVLEELLSGAEPRCTAPDFAPNAFKETVNYWREWIGHSTYRGRWRDEVHRSALVLKLLTFEPEGSFVAAATFALPEAIGGRRNWDYRYTWVRDAAFTLYALMRIGFTEEAAAFMRWVERRCGAPGPSGPLQVMYRIDGGEDLTERELPHLSGYMDSRPVRIGNGAYDQLQLDIYGALLDAAYLYDKYGQPISYDFWTRLVGVVDWVCENWNRPDEGIWEVRGEPKHFLNSRLLCWVALDRAVRLSRKRSLPAPIVRWIETRDAIYLDIWENFWNPEREAFVQYQGSDATDASALLMPLLRMVSPTDPRWLSTLRAIEKDLVDDAMVYRYRLEHAADDGFEEEEGSFSICSFWYAECLSRSGDLQQARLMFEKMLSYANHLGLYAEQLGPSGEHLGNFPQAFTHLALISAAFDLDRRLDGAGWSA
jgi:GH15 family glucan-1,4-alpha-glucosidase